MTTEQKQTIAALRTAMQMEQDGKEYYLRASQKSSSRTGQKLLRALAAEEDNHRQKFRAIYNALRNRKAWPPTDFQPDGGQRLRTILAQAIEKIDNNIEALPTELEAVQTALDLENKTYDYYTDQAGKATYDAERAFYQTLASEEREHHMVLLDYYEYLKDPASWFTKSEHSSLDGG